MDARKARKLLINTAMAGMIAGAGIGCSQGGGRTGSGEAEAGSGGQASPPAAEKNACGGKNGCGSAGGMQQEGDTGVQGGDKNACKAQGSGENQKNEAGNSCGGKASCAST